MKKEIEDYLNWKASYAQRAAVVYGHALRDFSTALKNKDVRKVSISDIVRYQQNLKTNGRDIYYPTVVIKNFFRWMLVNRYKVIDPWLIKPPKKQNRRRSNVTEEEFRKMDVLFGETYFQTRNRLILHLLWHTGMRVSEVVALKIGDLVFQQRKAIIKNKKNSYHRTILWPEETHKLFVRYMGIKLSENSSEFVFPFKNRALNQRQIQRLCKWAGKKAKIHRSVTPHQFRHGWAHYRMDRGAPVTFVQKGLGHTNPISTLVYEQYADRGFEKKARRYFIPSSIQ